MSAATQPNEIHLTRLYDAPVASVWDALTDAKRLAAWWGPRGFTITTHRRDLRPGGRWVFTMHGPDGASYPNFTTYLEVERQAKLVYDHGGNENEAPMFRVTMLLTEISGRTRLDMTMAFPSPEAARRTRAFVKTVQGEASWDRLAEYVEKERSGKESFVYVRSVFAPIERVYQMWADPQRFSSWMGPAGAQLKVLRADVRPGGSLFYAQSSEHGTICGRTEYVTQERPVLLVYRQQFCDEHENVIRHPLAATFPETLVSKVEFAAEGPNDTRVSLTWTLLESATSEELATFVAARPGMTQGWAGSFDKLDAALASS